MLLGGPHARHQASPCNTWGFCVYGSVVAPLTYGHCILLHEHMLAGQGYNPLYGSHEYAELDLHTRTDHSVCQGLPGWTK